MSRVRLPVALAAVAISVMVVIFVATVGSMDDPSALANVARPGDNRQKRLGHFTHAETVHLIRGLRGALAKARVPRDRALITLRLMDVYLGRKMHDRATEYLRQAQKLAPRLPEVQAREALLLHHQGQRVRARKLIRQALTRAPHNKDVQRVAKVVDPPTS